ncbi:PREDICTED: uncharacterized protein LOC105970829 [Erythranthe guttata]|uniref:uncharacterized protein LOC105970829 n=1 Tax=Erythranthe guttata TaxID=4155 RepID=UPI00064DD63B|nr:PREDICTED: uncharacterized protein LOC105970829 [Erythranthe guttata]|eukprot:XP_012851107.1 PREDICTED: uncharacterized protein LOC105970829 [Erythranthe guttata]
MAVGERQTQKHRRKTPSFSSSLLDAIYLSIDEPGCAAAAASQPHQQSEDFVHLRSNTRRNNAAHFEDEIASLRRAITNHLYTRTKSKAMKIYGELKKVKEPISPGGKIVNFFNSIFSPRNPKQKQTTVEEWSSSIRKSRSMRDPPTTSSKSCLIKNPSSSICNKSKRSVKFDENEYSVNSSMPSVKSRLIKKSVELFENESDGDDMSCASSDLFELENIGSYGGEELPVYGTTSIKMNRAIACGFAM